MLIIICCCLLGSESELNIENISAVQPLHAFLKKSFKIPKGVIRIRKSKDRLQNGQKKDKIYNIYKTLRIKLKIE